MEVLTQGEEVQYAPLDELGDLGALADRSDGEVAIDRELRIADGPGTATAACIGLPELHADALEGRNPVVVFDDPNGGGQEVHRNPLVIGLFDLERIRRHLLARAPVQDPDLIRAEPADESAVTQLRQAYEQRDAFAKAQRLVGKYRARANALAEEVEPAVMGDLMKFIVDVLL